MRCTETGDSSDGDDEILQVSVIF